MTLSDLVVNYLQQFKVGYVFSVPGGPIIPLYDALARREKMGGPRSVLARHESGAAFMADGYARASGRIGVCMATTGPGATNMITGVAEAYEDHIPMLVITAQTPIPAFSLGAFQESSADVTDIVGMFEHVTKYNTLVSHPDQLENKLAAALTLALTPPRGPAHLSMPTDILRAQAAGPIRHRNLNSVLTQPEARVDLAALKSLVEKVQDVLSADRRVVLLVGHDCEGAAQAIMNFAELIGANIISTQRGKSWVNPYHPLYKGVFGFAGHPTARMALSDESVGLIVAAGTSLSEWATAGWDRVLMNHRLVHIHNHASAFARSPMSCLHVLGTISTIFEELVIRIKKADDRHAVTPSYPATKNEKIPYIPGQIEVQAPEACLFEKAFGAITPQLLISEIIQRLPGKTRFFVDNSNSVPWTIHYFFSHCPEDYHLSIGFASMGWAIGASVGAALASPDSPSVCFTGDGCFLMSGQEITVAVTEKLPVIFVVLNDQAYGMIRHAHRLTGKERVDLSIPPVDFSMMARAVGADAHTIRSPEDLERIDFPSLCSKSGPTLLDVHIDPDEVPPLGMF
ncbi:conserved hypothetical protein [uncultured Desulfobacterium sp.]|uniref:Acetolactate synthase n=1 Tax=uncultured Desulfobacterium sp. TaxID=201089 RepID=A0A445N3U9_9BACT|nr:conserved hypothetical protein [uncultured Desulfobacterium sp.]